jgi:hypothetical protein
MPPQNERAATKAAPCALLRTGVASSFFTLSFRSLPWKTSVVVQFDVDPLKIADAMFNIAVRIREGFHRGCQNG